MDGTLPNRFQNVVRNCYFPLLMIAPALAFPWGLALPGFELTIFIWGPEGKRIGDWLAFTRVVEEQPETRPRRLAQKLEWEMRDV